VQRALLAAAIHPDNTPHGYNLTFAFFMLMFIIQAAVLYLRFRSPHRVPGHVALSASRWAGGTSAPRQGGPSGGASAASPGTAASPDAGTKSEDGE